MNQTPLFSQHLRLGARMGEFGGWDMPIQYAGILREHEHTRTKVSVFDICHMGEFEISGSSAASDLERLLTCNIASLKTGQVRYGFMLSEDGGTLDDLTCYRLDSERYMLVVNAGTACKDAAWIERNLSAGTSFVDVSESLAKLDVQGPESRQALEDVFDCILPDLGYFRFKEFDTGGASFILSRTGYTGEFGYEIYLPVDAVESLWGRLLEHDLVEPAGLGARDTLRLEMGYPLYGHELTEQRTPVDTSKGAFIDVHKDFIGRHRVQSDLDNPTSCLVGLKFESKRAARAHDRVFVDDAEVGEITSGSVAPSLGFAVAMAFVSSDYTEAGQILHVDIRGKRHAAQVVNLPFYTDGTARRR